MPSIIRFSAYPAQVSETGSMSVVFDLTGKPAPFPRRDVEVKTTADALAALEAYKTDAAATGETLAVSMRVKDGSRAPNGFKAATDKMPWYHRVNI